MEARAPPEMLVDQPYLELGVLHIGDGISKCLGGFLVWLSYCILAEKDSDDGQWEHPAVLDAVRSLLSIRTTFPTHGSGSAAEGKIASIVKQNCESKIQQVSSFTWACTLKSLGEGITFKGAIDLYLKHPDVVAVGARKITLRKSILRELVEHMIEPNIINYPFSGFFEKAKKRETQFQF